MKKVHEIIASVVGNKTKKSQALTSFSAEGFNDFSAIVDMVYEFHKLFQHPIMAAPTADLMAFRAELIDEEAGEREGLKAIRERNIDQALDAAGDTLYVAAGAFISIAGAGLGFVDSKEFDRAREEHLQFMMKNVSLPKHLGMAFQEAVDVAKKIASLGDVKSVDDLRQPFIELYRACDYIMSIVRLGGVDPVELVAEIHNSNMSKLWAYDDAVRKDQIARCKYDLSDLGFRVAPGRDAFIGYRLSDGKILKCPDYKKANLGEFVEQIEDKGYFVD